ncbi:MAG TPA: ANTAR domain-containing protein [Acidimicrobiales bacterium]|nr:ANTAR domain-containing protein [Acidimicrobiales bacterium]
MHPDARLRIVADLSAVSDERLSPRLGVSCAELTRVRGAAVTVMADAAHRGVLSASTATAAVLEELQTTLGEGPGIDAHRAGAPVTEPDLARSSGSRWLAFCRPALDAGAAAVFAFPLRLGAVGLGVLTLNHDHPGRLTDGQYVDALALCDVMTHALVAMQADAPPGTVAPALSAVTDDNVEVHQAVGMIAVRFGSSVDEALVRLRAMAYVADRPLVDVARDVVTRR